VGSSIPSVPSPTEIDLVAAVTPASPISYSRGENKVFLGACWCKGGIVRNLLERNITVRRVPSDYDFLGEDFDGVVGSKGPGDPKMCGKTIAAVRSVMNRGVPLFGICLGSQILALAAGGNTYKLKFGHRGQNQPCIASGTTRCFITSQNHGYAV